MLNQHLDDHAKLLGASFIVARPKALQEGDVWGLGAGTKAEVRLAATASWRYSRVKMAIQDRK